MEGARLWAPFFAQRGGWISRAAYHLHFSSKRPYTGRFFCNNCDANKQLIISLLKNAQSIV